MKKTRKSIIAVLAAGLMLFSVTGCDNNDDTTTTAVVPQQGAGDISSSKPATAPDRVSAIEGGYWMYKTKHPNIVIRVDVTNYTATMYEFSGYVAFSRYVKNQTALTGDIISQTQATKDWVFDIMRWTEAYKFSVGENEIYLYDSILGSAAIGTKNSASSGYSLDSVQASLLDVSIWKVLDKGTYVSPAVEINKANKYLYAVIELVDESDEKATFYVGDTDSITDFSSF